MTESVFSERTIDGSVAPYLRPEGMRCDVAGFSVMAMPPGLVDIEIVTNRHVVNIAGTQPAATSTIFKLNGSDIIAHTSFKDGVAFYPSGTEMVLDCFNPSHEILLEFDTDCLTRLMAEQTDGYTLSQNPVTGGIDPVAAMLARLAIEHLGQPVVDRLYIEGLAIAATARTLAFGLKNQTAPATRGTDARIMRATEFAHAYLTEGVTVVDLAAVACMSPSWFSRAFKAHTGFSVHGYILEQRLERARQDLILTDAPVGTIAHACGFADHSHLTRLFRRRYGVTPTGLRG